MNIYCLAISSIYAIKQRQFCLMSSSYRLYKQVGKDVKEKRGKRIKFGFYINRSVKISKVRGYQLWFDSWVIPQSARFIKEEAADGCVRVETITLRRDCNSVVSEIIPGVKSVENVPRFLETKVSIQVFSILIGNYLKRHSLNNFH